MEDKLRTVYKFLEDNNLTETLDLLKREIGTTNTSHAKPLVGDIDSSKQR